MNKDIDLALVAWEIFTEYLGKLEQLKEHLLNTPCLLPIDNVIGMCCSQGYYCCDTAP